MRDLKTNDDMSFFETHENWQATVRNEHDELHALMKGQIGGDFEGNFYLYPQDWYPQHGNPVGYSLNGTRSLFTSRLLTLVNGNIP